VPIIVLNKNDTKSDRIALQCSGLFAVANRLQWTLPYIRTPSGRVLELRDARGGLPPQYIQCLPPSYLGAAAA
jgi:hypothetical protein